MRYHWAFPLFSFLCDSTEKGSMSPADKNPLCTWTCWTPVQESVHLLCAIFSPCKHFHFLFISCQRASPPWCLPAKKDIRERLCCREEREYDPVHHPLDLVNKNSLKLSLTGTSAQNNSHRKKNSYLLTLPTVYLAITVDLKVPVCPTSAHNTCQIYTALGKVTVAFRTGLRKRRAQPDSVLTETPLASGAWQPYHRALKISLGSVNSKC